jgi:hypothetical protein
MLIKKATAGEFMIAVCAGTGGTWTGHKSVWHTVSNGGEASDKSA